MEGEAVVFRGQLTKRSPEAGMLARAQTRYFVLTTTHLLWFKSSFHLHSRPAIPQNGQECNSPVSLLSRKGAANSISINVYFAVPSTDSKFNKSISPDFIEAANVFMLVPRDQQSANARGKQGKSYVLEAKDQAQRDTWITMFNNPLALHQVGWSTRKDSTMPMPTTTLASSSSPDTVPLLHTDKDLLRRLAQQNLVTSASKLVVWGLTPPLSPQTSDAHVEIPAVLEPVQVRAWAGGSVVDVACGDNWLVVLVKGGADTTSVYMWGSMNKKFTENDSKIRRLPDLDTLSVCQLASGSHHCLALTSSGNVISWGSNVYGQLGLGSAKRLESPEPITIRPMPLCRVVAAGGNNSAAIALSGECYTWGANAYGQCGNRSLKTVFVPTAISLPTPSCVLDIACGLVHMLALTDSGHVFSWGCGISGRLGHDTRTPSATATATATAASSGGDSSRSAATDPPPECVMIPTMIPKLTAKRVVRLFAGDCHSAAITSTGKIYTWGSTDRNQLGRDPTDAIHPVSHKSPLTPYFHLCLGPDFTLGVTENYSLMIWGRISSGLNGNASGNTNKTATDQLTSVAHKPVMGLQGLLIAKVSSGLHFCAAIVISNSDSSPPLHPAIQSNNRNSLERSSSRINPAEFKELLRKNKLLVQENRDLREDREQLIVQLFEVKNELAAFKGDALFTIEAISGSLNPSSSPSCKLAPLQEGDKRPGARPTERGNRDRARSASNGSRSSLRLSASGGGRAASGSGSGSEAINGLSIAGGAGVSVSNSGVGEGKASGVSSNRPMIAGGGPETRLVANSIPERSAAWAGL